MPEGKQDEFMTEKIASNTSLTADDDLKVSETGQEAVTENNVKKEASLLPSIRLTQRISGGSDDTDKAADNGDNNEGKPDDIYSFDFSKDQKQAIQELFNLKLDLGFAAG